jgi:ubiquinone/menaquinone biosynthesis C-methylase UbiE
MSRKVQVPAEQYSNRAYFSLVRTISHWHQINAVAEQCNKGDHVLEVGPGCGHATWLLRTIGYQVTTLDINEDFGPDVVGDVTALDISSGTFDCVLAAEVLEHIPFDEFETALSELARVSRGTVVISLPAPFVGASFLLNLPKLNPMGLSIGVPQWVTHRFNGEHYWELGKKGYGKRQIRQAIENVGLNILKEFRPVPSLYSYFFVLRRP